MILNSYHKNILNFLSHINEDESTSLMDIGREVGLDHPQKVQDRIDQLKKEGYISLNPFGGYQIIRMYKDDGQLYLPFFGFAQCGNSGKEILSEYPRKKLPIDENLINSSEKDQYFITRAKGDSMEPFIKSGDFVLIKIQSGFHLEDRVLVVQNNKPKIKKIRTDGEKWVLHSLNKEHGDIIVEPYDDINIIGVVHEVFPSDRYDV